MPSAIAVPVFPDIDLLLVNFLAKVTFANAQPAVRVVTILPLHMEELPGPVVRVTRTAGTNRSLFTDRPIVDVDVFATTWAAASNAARLAQNAILFVLRGTTRDEGKVQNATTVVGPRWLPDINPALYRFSASYEFSTRP
jgi:hypothetical protein